MEAPNPSAFSWAIRRITRRSARARADVRPAANDITEFGDTPGGSADDEICRFLRTSSLVPISIAAWETGTLIHVNEAAAAMLGVPAAELNGRSILEFYVDPRQR